MEHLPRDRNGSFLQILASLLNFLPTDGKCDTIQSNHQCLSNYHYQTWRSHYSFILDKQTTDLHLDGQYLSIYR